MRRRVFLKNAAFLPLVRLATMHETTRGIGIHLDVVKEAISWDINDTFQQLKAMGILYAQVGNYNNGLFYGQKPDEIKTAAQEAKIQLVSVACKTLVTPDLLQKTIEDANLLGVNYLVNDNLGSIILRTDEDAQLLATQMSKAAEVAQKAGLLYCHHNTRAEITRRTGEIPLDRILKNTDGALINFEMDMFAMAFSGQNPIYYLLTYPNRFPLWRMRDCYISENNSERYSIECGKGSLDYSAIWKYAVQSGARYAFIGEGHKDKKPMESIKENIAFLMKA